MKSKYVNSLKSAAAPLAMLVAGVAAPMAFPAVAFAQDYTAGAISGTVTDDSGKAVQGATVVVQSKSTGASRTSVTSSNGSFRVTGLAPGAYDITVTSPNHAPYKAEAVPVAASQSASVNIALAAMGGDEIVVIGTSIIKNFEGSTTGINIDVASLVENSPIARDLTSLVLLAPGVSRGDDGFGNLPSIGGASVAENAYYVNGLNTTNFDNYLGSAQVPFEFYKSVEVKSGGYPAEYGRATGGIVNAVTKSGSNDFMAAVHLNWSPNFLRSDGRDLFNIDSVTGEKTKVTNRAADRQTSYSAIVELGGPIITDRLFAYGLIEFRNQESTTISRNAGLAFQRKNDDPFYGIKLDAYPVDNHHLEFTLFDTRNTTRRSDLSYSEVNGQPVLGLAGSVTDFKSGGVNYVAKYTGQFTNWLTVSGAYGRMRDRFDNIGVAGDAGAPYIRNLSGTTINGVRNGGFFNGQSVASIDSPYDTEREFYRADVDLYFSAFGEHHIRGGFDQEDNTLSKATVRNGGNFLFSNGYISPEAYSLGQGGAGFLYLLRPGGIVELNYFNSGGSFDARNRAFYLQDEWAITDRLTVNLGVRRDDFEVLKADGSKYASLKDNWAPRFGFTYDMFDDNSGKLYGSYGQYFLPFASNTAFRQVGSEFFYRQRWTYTSFDNNGVPILGNLVTTLGAYQASCPAPLVPGGPTTNCSVTGRGDVADSSALLAANLKATKETEWLIGYEHRLGDWLLGINYTNRRLNTTAEDVAIDAAVLAYCADQGISGCSSTWTGFHQYVITNPGRDLVVNLDGLDGRQVTFTAAQLGYPKAKRKYDAVTLSAVRPMKDGYTVSFSYVWSDTRGNSEGFVQSDFEQDDSGITQDFDQPGFSDFAYGKLPTHRRHRFRLFGGVELSDQFTIGTNIQVDSPRPLSCFGYHPTDVFARVYGAASRYCNGQPSPRGTAQKSDWIANFDVSLRYNMMIASGQKVTLRADVFNILNSAGIQQRNEIGEIDYDDTLANPYILNPNYGLPTSYQPPRSVRLGVDIAF